jgi:hypothetical protein
MMVKVTFENQGKPEKDTVFPTKLSFSFQKGTDLGKWDHGTGFISCHRVTLGHANSIVRFRYHFQFTDKRNSDTFSNLSHVIQLPSDKDRIWTQLCHDQVCYFHQTTVLTPFPLECLSLCSGSIFSVRRKTSKCLMKPYYCLLPQGEGIENVPAGGWRLFKIRDQGEAVEHRGRRIFFLLILCNQYWWS